MELMLARDNPAASDNPVRARRRESVGVCPTESPNKGFETVCGIFRCSVELRGRFGRPGFTGVIPLEMAGTLNVCHKIAQANVKSFGDSH